MTLLLNRLQVRLNIHYTVIIGKKQIILIDKYKVIVDLWKWLITAKESDILNLPQLKQGDNLKNFNLSNESRLLMGFWVGRGQSSPGYTATKWWNSEYWNKIKIRTAENLQKIRHWKIFYNEYENIPNKEATWFIDPPYQFGGERYGESNRNLNFESLGKWCQSRLGQVIVCENTKADWLPFKSLIKLHGSKHNTIESIYYQENNNEIFNIVDNKPKNVINLNKEEILEELKKRGLK
jgi:hypothetical protein